MKGGGVAYWCWSGRGNSGVGRLRELKPTGEVSVVAQPFRHEEA